MRTLVFGLDLTDVLYTCLELSLGLLQLRKRVREMVQFLFHGSDKMRNRFGH